MDPGQMLDVSKAPIVKIETTSSRVTSDSFYTLKLVRFKKFESMSLSIPATGIVLLKGDNGVGKSTIFEAVSFVMYDNAGNTCYPRKDRNSKKKLDPTSVELTFPSGLVIYRQRRPNLLRISGPGIELTDDVAQGYIDRTYGPYNGWLAGGYLEQEKPCAFFSMTSAEKLQFLQELSLVDRQGFTGPEQFEAYLNKVAFKYNEMTQQWKEIEFQMKLNYEMYMRLYNQMPQPYREFTLWPEERLTDLSGTLSKLKSDTQKELQTLQNRISEIRMQSMRFSEYTLQKERLEKARDAFQKELVDTGSVEGLPVLEKELFETNEQIQLARQTERRIQLVTVKTELQRKLEAIPSDKPRYSSAELDHYEKLLKGLSVEEYERQLQKLVQTLDYYHKFGLFQKYEALKAQAEGLKKNLETYPQKSYQKEIDDISKKIWDCEMQRKRLTCPKCNSSDIYLDNGCLKELVYSTTSHECVPELQQMKFKYQQEESRFSQREQVERQFNLINEQFQQFASMYSSKLEGFDPLKKPELVASIPQIEHLIEQIKIQKEQRSKVPDVSPEEERRRIFNENERNRLSKDIVMIDTELSGLATKEDRRVDVSLSLYTTLEKRRTELTGQIQELKKTQMSQVATNANLRQVLAQLVSLVSVEMPKETTEQLESEAKAMLERSQRSELEINGQMYLYEMSKLYRVYESQQKNYQEASLKLTSLHKIRSCLVTAEYIVLDNILSQINSGIAETLDQLFPTESVSVSLRSMKQLKTDDRIKPEINCEIIVDGAECATIREVSGGERSRVCLAMIIAFSSFSNIPFVFLDEALSSLHVSAKESTISTIRRQLASNKLVIAVNHDTTEGVYDSIITLQNS